MNKRFGKVLHTHVWIYFVLLFGFAAAALLAEQFVLAAAEAAVAAIMLVAALLQNQRRKKELQKFLSRVSQEQNGRDSADSPFPMAVIRLSDGGVLFANDAFAKATGYDDTMTQRSIQELLPGIQTDWLLSGKTEYPYDVTALGRRYRVYGSAARGDDPGNTFLGILYLSDLTELYH